MGICRSLEKQWKDDDMADIAIITGATGGIGMEFVKAVHLMDGIDEISAVGRNKEKLKR